MGRFIRSSMVVAMVLCGALAFVGCGDDSGDDSGEPIYISNADELAEFARQVNAGNTYAGKTVTLTADIDLSAYGSNYNDGKGWIPIGIGCVVTPTPPDAVYTDCIEFNGVFDGAGKTISGLYINDEDRLYVGLFGSSFRGTIKNLGVVNADIVGRGYVGGVIGSITEGEITNCYSTGTVRSTGYRPSHQWTSSSTGGLVGLAWKSRVIKSYSTVSVSANYDDVGGLAGTVGGNGSKIENSYSTGTIEGRNSIGGITGTLIENGSVISCYSTGTVNGANYIYSVGGIVGWEHLNASVSNCVALNPYMLRVVGDGDGSVSQTNNVVLGSNITIEEIHADGSIGGRFTAANGWTIQNGKLPGLSGVAVDMPEHLSL